MILKVWRCQFPCDSIRSLKSIPAIGQESQFVGVRTLSWNRFWSLCDLLRFIHRLRNLSQSMFPSWKISLEIQRDGRSYGLRFYFALYEFNAVLFKDWSQFTQMSLSQIRFVFMRSFHLFIKSLAGYTVYTK